MIRHIVILQFKKTPINYRELLEATRPLIEKIPGVIQYSIYPNESHYVPQGIISFGVEIVFKDPLALDVFMKHPHHFKANALFEHYLADPPYMVLTYHCS